MSPCLPSGAAPEPRAERNAPFRHRPSKALSQSKGALNGSRRGGGCTAAMITKPVAAPPRRCCRLNAFCADAPTALSVAACNARLLQRQHRLDAIAHLQLLHDVGHVMLDRLFADLQLDGDLFVGTALGDVVQDLLFALGEIGEFGWLGAAARLPPRQREQAS